VNRRLQSAVCAFAGAAGLLVSMQLRGVHGQEQAPAAQPRTAVPRIIVVIDPGHGGTDPGADLGNKIVERDVTFSVATKLRAALSAEGFSTVLTRDSQATDSVSADQRATIANRSHAAACVSLHATRSGSSVHVYTSALQPVSDTEEAAALPMRWEMAQERFVARSAQLAATLKSAFGPMGMPAVVSAATVPPLDSMICPAVAIEFAPLNTLEASGKGAEDAHYQDWAVRAITAALVKWRADNSSQTSPAKAAQ